MKILIGLSGGLDSTYAALFLKENGHDVTGASVIMHEHTDTAGAREAAETAGIPYIEIDCRDKFREKVIGNFINEYMNARTPNPCIMCNPNVKFGSLCEYAAENGFDRVSTGHYASVINENGRYFIRRGSDAGKDQSYVLWGLTQTQLSMLYFPLAEMKKSDIREEAAKRGLEVADAPESQEICFIPDNDYVGYIERATGITFPEGNFVDGNGNVLGKHKGLIRYTVGQRKGLGIALGQPMFVSKLDPDANTVTLVPSGSEYSDGMTVGNLNFMKMPPCCDGTVKTSVRVRYSHAETPCTVIFDGDHAKVTFDKPVRAVTPGQSAVFYDGDDLLFGGIILVNE